MASLQNTRERVRRIDINRREKIKFRGFYGDYEMEITIDGKNVRVGETPKDSTAGLWFWCVPNPIQTQKIHSITLKNITGKEKHGIAVIAVTAEQEL